MSKNVTVYCSMATNLSPSFYHMAEELGVAMAAAGYTLVYGGSNRGLMGSVADGVLASGGRAIGVYPNVPALLPYRHEHLSELVLVEEMRERKRVMWERGDAFIALPGGYGTLDEVFEVLTLRKLELHHKTMYFLNHDNFWQKMSEMLEHFIAEGTMDPAHRDFYRIVDSVPELMALLAADPHMQDGQKADQPPSGLDQAPLPA